MLVNHTWLYDVVRSGAELGNSGFRDHWQRVAERVDRTQRWYATNQSTLIGALA